MSKKNYNATHIFLKMLFTAFLTENTILQTTKKNYFANSTFGHF